MSAAQVALSMAEALVSELIAETVSVRRGRVQPREGTRPREDRVGSEQP